MWVKKISRKKRLWVSSISCRITKIAHPWPNKGRKRMKGKLLFLAVELACDFPAIYFSIRSQLPTHLKLATELHVSIFIHWLERQNPRLELDGECIFVYTFDIRMSEWIAFRNTEHNIFRLCPVMLLAAETFSDRVFHLFGFGVFMAQREKKTLSFGALKIDT